MTTVNVVSFLLCLFVKDMDQLLQDLLAKKTNIDEQGRNIERERNELDGEKASLEIEVDVSKNEIV